MKMDTRSNNATDKDDKGNPENGNDDKCKKEFYALMSKAGRLKQCYLADRA